VITFGQVELSLESIRKVYARILDSDARAIVLPAAKSLVQPTWEHYEYTRKNRARGIVLAPWGYTIDHAQPLRFIPVRVNGIELQVDIYCDIRWENDDHPVTQDIKIRIWSNHPGIGFDPMRDAAPLEESMIDPIRPYLGRVISRVHFDRANTGQPGPQYHLQFGGKPEPYELCWHPESVKVPRLEYQPMELFLTCQLIAANFFPDEYADIHQRSEWRQQLIWCQELLLLSHYERCLTAIRNKDSLLDALSVR